MMIIDNAFALGAIADACYLYGTGNNYRPMIKINDKIMMDLHKGVTNENFNKLEVQSAKGAVTYSLNHLQKYLRSNNADKTDMGKMIATTHLKLANRALHNNGSTAMGKNDYKKLAIEEYRLLNNLYNDLPESMQFHEKEVHMFLMKWRGRTELL